MSMGGGMRYVSIGEGTGHMSVGGDSAGGGKESGDANASPGRKWAPPAKGSTIRGTNVGGLGLRRNGPLMPAQTYTFATMDSVLGLTCLPNHSPLT